MTLLKNTHLEILTCLMADFNNGPTVTCYPGTDCKLLSILLMHLR